MVKASRHRSRQTSNRFGGSTAHSRYGARACGMAAGSTRLMLLTN